eukprot:COSAG02_NODE_370_length_23672_cov_318.104738_17_plen_95_part_00
MDGAEVRTCSEQPWNQDHCVSTRPVCDGEPGIGTRPLSNHWSSLPGVFRVGNSMLGGAMAVGPKRVFKKSEYFILFLQFASEYAVYSIARSPSH